jgi:four helix bundle protein
VVSGWWLVVVTETVRRRFAPWLVVGGWWLVVVTETVRNYKELRVWQGAMELVERVYLLSAAFPLEENYGLKSQIRRAAVSIPSNIAEGQSRASTKEFLNHLSIAQASLAEVETQLEISVRLKYVSTAQTTVALAAIQKLGKQLHALRKALEARK